MGASWVSGWGNTGGLVERQLGAQCAAGALPRPRVSAPHERRKIYGYAQPNDIEMDSALPDRKRIDQTRV